LAQSVAHRFGQIIGEVLEDATLPLLEGFAREHGLYLDRKGSRPCRSGVKCTWLDHNGNKHDLDFVMERGGTPGKKGEPVAFIETAWRRYTKHSRNKAQEIQGAIEPIAETYKNIRPFKGAILAGVFTAGALNQLESLGFTVLYFSYDSVVKVFSEFGIDAAFDETTPEDDFQRKVNGFTALSPVQKASLVKSLLTHNSANVTAFLKSLEVSVNRKIERIIVVSLHGRQHETVTVDDAITFIEGYIGGSDPATIDRYEIDVRYCNGDSIRGNFADKASAIQFLLNYKVV
jgi:hypothetical protein